MSTENNEMDLTNVPYALSDTEGGDALAAKRLSAIIEINNFNTFNPDSLDLESGEMATFKSVYATGMPEWSNGHAAGFIIKTDNSYYKYIAFPQSQTTDIGLFAYGTYEDDTFQGWRYPALGDMQGEIAAATSTAKGTIKVGNNLIIGTDGKLDVILNPNRNLIRNSRIEYGDDSEYFAYREMDVVAEETYVFSATAKMDVNELTENHYGEITISNEDNTFIRTLQFNTREREQKFISFTADVTETLSVRSSYFPNPSDKAGEFYVEYYKLEKGQAATDWFPAPEDIEDLLQYESKNNQRKFEQKKLIHTAELSNGMIYVIPVCSLENEPYNDTYCNGTFRLKKSNGKGGMDYTAELRVSKISESSEPSFNLRVDGPDKQADFNIRPVKYTLDEIPYFGLYLDLPQGSSGETVNHIEFSGRCHDWDLLDLIKVYDKAKTGDSAICNEEIYSSKEFLEGKAETHKFYGNIQAPNLFTDEDFTSQAILDLLVGATSSGSNFNADTLDGKHYHDIESYVSRRFDNLAVGARNLVRNSWIAVKIKANQESPICRKVSVMQGQSYVFSAAGYLEGDYETAIAGRVTISGTESSFHQILEFSSKRIEKKFLLFTAARSEELTISSYLETPEYEADKVEFYVEYYKLEIGNKMTDWLPAPEDINEKIIAVQLNNANGYTCQCNGQGSSTNSNFTEWRAGESLEAGSGASAGTASVAFGKRASAQTKNSVAIGYFATSGDYSVTTGSNSTSAQRAVSIGEAAYSQNYSVAVGNSVVSGSYSVTTGYGSTSTQYAVSIGNSVNSQDYSVAIGNSSSASLKGVTVGASTRSGNYGTAMGYNAVSANYMSAAFGSYSQCFGDWATAVGANSTAMGDWATAVGANSTALGYRSSAVGANSYTSYSDRNIMMLGDCELSAIKCYKGSIQVTSDIRDKIDVNPIEKALEFITSINPIRYVHNFRENYMKNVKETLEYEDIIEEVMIPDEFVEVVETDENGEEITVRKSRTIQIKRRVEKELSEEEIKNNEIIKKRKKYRLSDYDKDEYVAGIHKGNRQRVGVSAQQVEEVMKELYGTDNYANIISDNLHDEKETPEGVESMKTANYEGFIPFLIGAIQELTQEFNNEKTELRAKISELESEIEEIKQRIS